MAKKSSKAKSVLSDQDNKQILLEIIATNTMCTRRAVGVVAKVGMAFLVSSLLVVVAAGIVAICSLFFGDKLFKEQVWIPIVAGIISIIAWVSAVIYSVSLLGDLDDTVELVDQNEAEFFGDDEDDEDQEDQNDETE